MNLVRMMPPTEPVERWLTQDAELLRTPAGWNMVRGGADVALARRPCADDGNDLFRWQIARIDAPPEVVQDAFVDRVLELHAHWTKEFVGGEVVRRVAPGDLVVHQRFHSELPGIAKRDVCHRSVTRREPDGAVLTSHRPVEEFPVGPGYVRIRWWGASLVEAGDAPGTTRLTYIDRENQGGGIPAFVGNLVMPGYLRYQATRVRDFFSAGKPAR